MNDIELIKSLFVWENSLSVIVRLTLTISYNTNCVFFMSWFLTAPWSSVACLLCYHWLKRTEHQTCCVLVLPDCVQSTQWF